MEKIESLRNLIKINNCTAMLISNIPDIRYLSGFTGSTAYIIILLESAPLFFTDGRYEVQIKDEVGSSFDTKIVSRYKEVFDILSKYKRILLQPSCTYDIVDMVSSLGSSAVPDLDDTLKHMRMIKTPDEIALISNQYKLAASAFKASLPSFRHGVSESEWAAELEYNIKILGADGVSFETITASGNRGAMPHGAASAKIIEPSDPVIIDFGSRKGYTSDYTRMVYSGEDSLVLNVMDTVRTALLKSIDAIKIGAKCRDIDNIARQYIEDAGYGAYFNHSLGHGVGLDVHELPVLNKISDDIITEGMVFTIEPGVYLPGKFGVRMEDTVYMSPSGAEILSSQLDRYCYPMS